LKVTEEAFTGEAALEEDLAIAARTRVPVLITASRERALTIALTVATRSDAAGTEGMQVCDTAAGEDVLAALSENRLRTSRDRGPTAFLLREVDMLTESQQAAVMRLLDTRPPRALEETPRIITTSSVSLFDRVKQGSFDARLFYRLNVIHIVAP
jgi:transcriptional regulator of acetoin/glycerol metabolism